MALSSLIGRASLPALKSTFFRHTTNEFLNSNRAICVFSQAYFRQLAPVENFYKGECVPFKYNSSCLSLINFSKKFSTSPLQLAGHQSHDHSKIWTFERLLSVSLLPLVPAALMSPCQELDIAMALVIVLHTHFGLEAMIVDYVRPILFGNLAPKIGIGLLYLFSIVTVAGLLNLIINDAGLANTILNIWKK